MKKLMNAAFVIFLVTSVVSVPLYGVRSRAKKVEAPIERVTQGVSALEQIMDQVKLIVEFEDPTSLARAKKQLISLMGNKALNPKIKEVIKEDIEIVTSTTDASRKAAQQAYDRLKVVAKQVEAQANVVAAIEEGAALVKNASMDAKEEAIKAAQKKIEEAQQEQGWLQYLYTGAKRVITAPVNYVFGEESSKAKTAFYTTVGAAVLAAGAYGVSQYGAASEEEKESATLPLSTILSSSGGTVSEASAVLPLREDRSEIKRVEQGPVAGGEVKEAKEIVGKPQATSPFEEYAVEAKSIKQEQLENVINYSAVERFMDALKAKNWFEQKQQTEGFFALTHKERQESEEINKEIYKFEAQKRLLNSLGIFWHDIDAAFKVQEKAVKAAENEKIDRVMVDLAETQRKYLKSADPEDRKALYVYEKDINSKPYYIPWKKIYESRNKIREEEGIGKDFELALLVKIQRKHSSGWDPYKSTLQRDVSKMFDTLSPREINTIHDRVIKEIEEGIHFTNITAQLTGDEGSNREFKEFTQKFAPPLNIQETIESDKDKKFGFLKGRNESDDVYVKGNNYSRFFNAERMRTCIERNGFVSLAVAQKWVYKVNGQWRVYAEYIPEKKATFTLDEIQELAELAEQTGYRDWGRLTAESNRKKEILGIDAPNVVEDTRNGKMTIIDTEDKSFQVDFVMYPDKSFPMYCKLQSAYNLYMYFYKEMDDDARKWLEERIAYLEHNPEGRDIIEPLPWSAQFDDPNFDFAKMKEELEEDTNQIKY